MQLEQTMQQLRRQQEVVRDVLNQYVKNNDCPCHWHQFEYWASKHQGPGWQDELQNDLVSAALQLYCFKGNAAAASDHGYGRTFACAVCGREWTHSSEEWRMLAFRERLIPLKPSVLEPENLVSSSTFATAGFSPQIQRTLTLEQWVQYMTDGTKQEAIAHSDPAPKKGLLERLRSAFKLRV